VSTAQGSGFNRVLQFPREVSLENYVMLQPDFNDIQEELTICGWVQFYRTEGGRYWFSYATGGGDNQILFGNQVNQQHFLGNPMPTDYYTKPLTTFTWYHTCFSWNAGSQYEELYLNGDKVSERISAANSKLPTGGTLVLGQEQDTPGGGFALNQAFGGEIYGLQVFKRKLSGAEVEDMYKAGICNYPTPSEGVVIDWEDFLDAQRYGKVEEISAGCSKWEILRNFVGQEITPELISYFEALL